MTYYLQHKTKTGWHTYAAGKNEAALQILMTKDSRMIKMAESTEGNG